MFRLVYLRYIYYILFTYFSNRNSGDDGDDEEDDEENDEEYDSVPRMDTDRITSSQLLPWGVPKERARFPSNVNIETDIRPGEFVMRTLFAEFTIQVRVFLVI